MLTTLIPFREMSASITIEKPRPLPGHLAPLDQRHRWLYVKTMTLRGRREVFRYRCPVCRRWKSVEPIINLLARKAREAKHRMDEYLSETLWTV